MKVMCHTWHHLEAHLQWGKSKDSAQQIISENMGRLRRVVWSYNYDF